MFFKPVPLPLTSKEYSPLFTTEQIDLHYEKHYLAYIKNLNNALSQCESSVHHWSIIKILTSLDLLPENLRQVVKNNAGGYINHTLFWKVINTKKTLSSCFSTNLLSVINQTFHSFDGFKSDFMKHALNFFGSGWVWLVFTKEKTLKIVTTQNQDSPYLNGEIPLFGIDLWEHTYYLQYKNAKSLYLEAIWTNINWTFVDKVFTFLTYKTSEELTDPANQDKWFIEFCVDTTEINSSIGF